MRCLCQAQQHQAKPPRAADHTFATVSIPRLRLVSDVVKRSAAACLAGGLLLCGTAEGAEPEAAFATKCAGCHVAGGNIVQPAATLFTADLQRNRLDTPEALFTLIYSGQGRMPGFGTDCAPRGACTFGPRLSDEDIRGLAQYVLEQAQHDWK